MIIRKVNELLYTRISDWNTGHTDFFTIKEINSIKSQIFLQYEVDYCKVITSNEILGRGSNGYVEVTIRKGDITNHFAIYKLIDEWYIVSWKGNYWKCDQIDGLISCILENIVKSDIIKESTNTLISKIKRNLTPDLLKGIWKNDDLKNYSGYCYVATEALWWMLGGPDSQYTPYVLGNKDWPEVLKKGETHWFLKSKVGKKIIDPTKEQFGDVVIPYEKGHPNGMMNYPVGGSKRAKVLMARISKGRS